MSSGPSASSNPADGSSKRDPRYVDLGLDAPEPWSKWSNDPSKMKLDTYFCLNNPNVPGLAAAYKLPGLKPVIVKCGKPGSGYKFLLKDDTNSFFLFNENANEMYRFIETLSDKDAVELVETGTYDITKLEMQYQVRRQGQSG
ncbi:unnamed protein product [Clonostachys rhizophaga]|uniref:Uncharacterized protein n=1 Tax=Clonostachys rhizophaga TaxID=160324 RepID=A0A9N9VF80_9HYPO|nr:unnamed protein product [Clonostachys rhizophaga]